MTPETLQALARIQAGYRAILAVTRAITDELDLLARQGHAELADALAGDTARLTTQAAHVFNGLTCRLREANARADAERAAR